MLPTLIVNYYKLSLSIYLRNARETCGGDVLIHDIMTELVESGPGSYLVIECRVKSGANPMLHQRALA